MLILRLSFDTKHLTHILPSSKWTIFLLSREEQKEHKLLFLMQSRNSKLTNETASCEQNEMASELADAMFTILQLWHPNVVWLLFQITDWLFWG